MQVALVHEWFNEVAGSEKCVGEFNTLYPDADIFALVDWLDDASRQSLLGGKQTQTSFIQRLPFARKHFRQYLPLFPIAIEQFNLDKYDLVLSSSHLVAKGALTHHGQLHVCYCHTPVRYAWDMYHDYLRGGNLQNSSIKSWLSRRTLHHLRLWDVLSSNRVDHFIANSHYIRKRIQKIYRREAHVIYPPVDTNRFSLVTNKDDYYLAFSRLVPYKRIDLIVQAFAHTKRKLVVVGNGPEMEKLRGMATPNIEFLGFQDDQRVAILMQQAKALVFAALEDFGIIPVEAQACGTPVICLNQGGTAETVLHGKTGIHFQEQSVAAIRQAVDEFEARQTQLLDAASISEFAQQFSVTRFRQDINQHIAQLLEQKI
ncbi:glycosyltransferase [Thiothrix subterranea]|uniref:Glycosyltransferase n=1 Tax=Thiothrix subterranea TaxID=2735563 RepID=A0AA51R4S1_9GAMM|nr:glycosyltransferase [Thiothrix subterranea]MDQ5768373.1 glycosyltransferase [Thiothrix subterranea]WML86961.1 glycosyltransferase [Thiothrix subterranea]